MATLVPPEITAELTQILSNLVLGDNEIRSSAENAVNERLARTPELYILALAQFALAADNSVMRSFSLVLLRRLLFRADLSQTATHPRLTLYDRLSAQTLAHFERLLLHSLSEEPDPSVRRKSVDTICDLANAAMNRGRPWHALQAQAFSMAQAPEAIKRESAFASFAGCPLLVCDLQTEAMLGVFERGLSDPESVEVRHSALKASVAYLVSSDAPQLAQSLGLLHPMLQTLTSLPTPHHLAEFLITITSLASSHASLFAPHLQNLLGFLPSVILPRVDSGPTPTAKNPKGFEFPLPGDDVKQKGKAVDNGDGSSPGGAKGEEESEAEEARKAGLELMVTLSEAKPGMVKKVEGWVPMCVRACLEGMGEIDVEMEGGEEAALATWLEVDPSSENVNDDESYPFVYEQSLDRLSCALGGKPVLGPAFQYIPSMLVSYDWRVRHAGLMAIAAVAEGGSQEMQNELGKVVELVLPLFSDSNPRVRYAACQCVGQLCTDLESIIQEQYHAQLFSVLIPTLEAPEPRVHSHAAAALINFCEGVERDTLLPYLDPIVERLLKLLHVDGTPDANGATRVKRYVQEQVITSLAMVADASEQTFAKHYGTIMPLLLNVLRNADGSDYRKLRVKAMECAGLIAIAVGREVFRPDSVTLVELLMRIQNSPADPNDTLLPHYLIATWGKICQALGAEFEPYLPVVMPPLLTTASVKADVSVYNEDEEVNEEREGWETVSMDGQTVGIRTSALEEKCQAFDTLVIYSSTLGPKFAPYLAQTLELALPSLRFTFHEGVREACAMLITSLLSCGQASSTLTTNMVSHTFLQLINVIAVERDISYLASLYKCFSDSLAIIGGPASLSAQMHDGILEATKRQLQFIADRRKARAARPAAELEEDREDLALLEEMEDFALEDMGKMLAMFDVNHPLLVAVTSVKQLGMNQWDEGDGDDEG